MKFHRLLTVNINPYSITDFHVNWCLKTPYVNFIQQTFTEHQFSAKHWKGKHSPVTATAFKGHMAL